MKDISRIIRTSFWTDNKVSECFTPEDRYFMLYLLTNPHTTQLGIYEFSVKVSAFEMGYSQETIIGLLDRFENTYGVIKYSKDTKEVAIKNYLRHSIVKGGKPVFDCLVKEESKVKDKSLVRYIMNYLRNLDDINYTVKEFIDYVIENEKDKDNDNDNDNERIVDESSSVDDLKEDKNKSIHDIVDYLNLVCGTNYKDKTANTRKHISARLNEGYTFDDFALVIDKKASEWKGTTMEQYLRPDTLFGTKFESYLNQRINKPKSNNERDLFAELRDC